MSQLENIGKMLREKQSKDDLGKAAEQAALKILREYEAKGEFDPREVARRISDAIAKVNLRRGK